MSADKSWIKFWKMSGCGYFWDGEWNPAKPNMHSPTPAAMSYVRKFPSIRRPGSYTDYSVPPHWEQMVARAEELESASKPADKCCAIVKRVPLHSHLNRKQRRAQLKETRTKEAMAPFDPRREKWINTHGPASPMPDDWDPHSEPTPKLLESKEEPSVGPVSPSSSPQYLPYSVVNTPSGEHIAPAAEACPKTAPLTPPTREECEAKLKIIAQNERDSLEEINDLFARIDLAVPKPVRPVLQHADVAMELVEAERKNAPSPIPRSFSCENLANFDEVKPFSVVKDGDVILDVLPARMRRHSQAEMDAYANKMKPFSSVNLKELKRKLEKASSKSELPAVMCEKPGSPPVEPPAAKRRKVTVQDVKETTAQMEVLTAELPAAEKHAEVEMVDRANRLPKHSFSVHIDDSLEPVVGSEMDYSFFDPRTWRRQGSRQWTVACEYTPVDKYTRLPQETESKCVRSDGQILSMIVSTKLCHMNWTDSKVTKRHLCISGVLASAMLHVEPTRVPTYAVLDDFAKHNSSIAYPKAWTLLVDSNGKKFSADLSNIVRNTIEYVRDMRAHALNTGDMLFQLAAVKQGSVPSSSDTASPMWSLLSSIPLKVVQSVVQSPVFTVVGQCILASAVTAVIAVFLPQTMLTRIVSSMARSIGISGNIPVTQSYSRSLDVS